MTFEEFKNMVPPTTPEGWQWSFEQTSWIHDHRYAWILNKKNHRSIKVFQNGYWDAGSQFGSRPNVHDSMRQATIIAARRGPVV